MGFFLCRSGFANTAELRGWGVALQTVQNTPLTRPILHPLCGDGDGEISSALLIKSSFIPPLTTKGAFLEFVILLPPVSEIFPEIQSYCHLQSITLLLCPAACSGFCWNKP